MATKTVVINGIGPVTLYKRKGVKGVRISVSHEGNIRVSLPSWAPYQVGIEFAKNKTDWILEQYKPPQVIKNHDKVGKAHTVVFMTASVTKPTTRLAGTEIRVYLPSGMPTNSSTAQEYATKAAIRALKKEANQLLPQRLNTLAIQHGFTYTDVSIKQLKSRWGSCNERKEIVLNCYLMQLPWQLIDYVLLHELVHTKIMQHGAPFWAEFGLHMKDVKTRRKEIKQHKPTLITTAQPVSFTNPTSLDVKTF